MLKQNFLPEPLYEVDPHLTPAKLSFIFSNSDCVTGKVIRLDSRTLTLIVDLGGGIIGTMPYTDATIYPIYKDNGELSPYIYTLVGKKIRAKIISIDDNLVSISRKANMLEALEYFKEQKEISFAAITGFSRISAFIDIGAGIMARCYGKNFSTTVYRDIRDIGFQKNEILSFSILGYDDYLKMFELERPIPPIEDIYVRDDIVTCKVFEPLKDDIGYFVCIDRNFSGIVDSAEKLKYGDTISAIISKITDRGPRSDLVEKLV